MTGQGIVKAPFVENKEWFKTLIAKPSSSNLERFDSFEKSEWAANKSVNRDNPFQDPNTIRHMV